MRKFLKNYLGPCVFFAALVALFVAVPAFGGTPIAWRKTVISAGVLAPVADCTAVDAPYTGCTGSGTGTFEDFPETYDLNPGRSSDLAYQFNYTCTDCDGSNDVTVTLECTLDEVKWRTLATLVTAASANQDIGPISIRMDDPAGDVTTGEVLCYKYRLNFVAAAGTPAITALNISYFSRSGSAQ